ncbi:hypothetical protein [Tenacibaculum soleae]|uniref:hypothetical protein n=1 Tax=Tenacibaculum soleae TaxID=447689 RepID=UPI002301C399|nr:hypothetical protein [Tenacibaculum soleae]
MYKHVGNNIDEHLNTQKKSMGIFNFSKKEELNYTDFNTMMIDNVYLIKIPKEWNKYESDRFRARTKNKKIDFSITNYGKEISTPDNFGIEDLKNQFLPLFDKFVNEGGYVSNKDLEIGENFIYQSFKVGKETQYYYYTSRVIKNDLRVVIALIIRQIGKLEPKHTELIKDMGKSITHKIA